MKQFYLKMFTLLALLTAGIESKAYDCEVNGIYYNLSGTEAIVTSGDNPYSGDITIPMVFSYNNTVYQVTAIDDYAFNSNEKLSSVVIPSGVKTIGIYAFESSGIKNITLPATVTTIGECAFQWCKQLVSVSLPNSVDSIGNETFEYCTLLASVNIPSSLKNIPYRAFHECRSLTSIVIPEGVTSIGERAFSGCLKLKEVSFPNTLKKIGESAFSSCVMTSITIPESVTEIGKSAFFLCSNLANISIPDNLAKIGSEAFHATAWYKAQPDGKVYIGNVFYEYKGAVPENTNLEIKYGTVGVAGKAGFSQSGIITITFPETLKYIGDYAFRNCDNLGFVNIPEGVKGIGKETFCYCQKLSYAMLPSTLEIIGQGAFSSCIALTSMTLPNNLKHIEESVFYDCNNLLQVNLPDSLVFIGHNAFSRCSSLMSVAIPAGIKEIEYGAFTNCKNLKTVTSHSIDPPIFLGGDRRFANGGTLYIPAGTRELYEERNWPREFAEIIELEELAIKIESTYHKEEVKAMFNLDGHQVNREHHGLNIVHLSDGTTRKVMVK